MSFKAYLNRKFDTTHENIFFDELVEKFSNDFKQTNSLVVLLGNFFYNNRDIDAMLIKNDTIIIIDFKDYGGNITFSENDVWKAGEVIIKGGAAINPFLQLRTTKNVLIEFFNENQKKIFDGRDKYIKYNDLYCMVLFHSQIKMQKPLPGNIKKWFFVSDHKKVSQLLKNIVNKNINLSDNEIENIPKLLEIKEYRIAPPTVELLEPPTIIGNNGQTVQLTEEQERIKRLDEGIQVVLAPPGAGKTTLLAERIAFALVNGITENKIISLTFTNRAARNMEEKVNSIIENDGVFIGSFHNFGYNFLISNEIIEHGSVVLDEEEVNILLQESVEECIKNDASGYSSLINNYFIESFCNLKKQQELGLPETVLQESQSNYKKQFSIINSKSIKNNGIELNFDLMVRLLDLIYIEYQKLKDIQNGLDYNDILNLTLAGLNDSKNVEMRNYDWLQADEAQDLNPIQWEIFDRLSSKNAHIAIFGDTFQSIFGFLGATPNLFTKRIGKYKKHYLRTNFRSPSYLISFYNDYINKNFKDNSTYQMIPYYESIPSEDDFYYAYLPQCNPDCEMSIIVSEIIPKIKSNCAILLRNNKDVDTYSSRLNDVGIKHFKVSNKDIFRKNDIKNLLSIIGVMVNPKNRLNWTRIYSLFLNLEIKKCRIITAEVFKAISSNPFHLFKKDFVFDVYPKLKPYQIELEKFKDSFKVFLNYFLSNNKKHTQLGIVITDVANLLNNLGMIDDPEFEDDLEKIVKYINHTPKIGTLQTVVLNEFRILIRLKETDLILDDDKLIVSTIHKAKGLEWDTVIVPQCNNKVFPSFFDNSQEDIDESARLLFVALTRAKKQLIISYHTLNIFNKPISASPFVTDFLGNIPRKSFVNKPPHKIPPPKPRSDINYPPILIGAFDSLFSMIGLNKAKEQISSMISSAQFIKQREKMGLSTNKGTLHLVFAGNPGTGKTTVARMVGKIYKEIGFLSKGHLVETDRSDLVAEYVGHTAIKTKKKVEEAKGGVLFIDEAYSLNSGSNNDFGKEAIETLLKMMEDYRDDLIVIVAGYTDKMDGFINSNPGLQSRFSNVVIFEDYSTNELIEILAKMVTAESFMLTDSAIVKSSDVIYSAKTQEKISGNARTIRNYFEKIKLNMSKRVSQIRNPQKEVLMEIKDIDIPDIL